MAIVQVSQITNRKGLTENLPQLAGAEFGWAVDSRRLFIGNGTLEEGAPVIGNTEILTEFSDITVLSNYTYADIAVGYAAQTGPTPSSPIVRTVQAKLDDFADVRDFGAVGDGTTDDTAAINRALYQLYCVDNNTAVRRALYFPAGTYIVSSSIVIPSYAKLIGEGADCSIIQSITADTYVAQYGDSAQQTGVNIGNNNATPPRNIEISSLTFKTTLDSDVFLVIDATQCYFDSVNFEGYLTKTDIITNLGTDDIAGIRFSGTNTYICNQITFDKCRFTGMTYGIQTDQQIQSVTVSNSVFDILYQGIVLGDGTVVNGGATGFRAVQNMFNNVYEEGIVFGAVNLNVSAYNIFYDVGNEYTGSPSAPNILIASDNNVSISDMFARVDADALVVPRIAVTGTTTDTTSQLQLGRYGREIGKTFTISDGQTNHQIFQINALDIPAFKMDYTITRDAYVRTGTITVVRAGAPNSLQYTDDYSENTNTGVTLLVSQSINTITVSYTSTAVSLTGTLLYSISQIA